MTALEWNISPVGADRARLGRLAAGLTLLGAAVTALPATPAVGAASAGQVYAAIGFANGGATLLVGHLGEQAHKIVQGADPAAIETPAVAPGGSRIAYVANDAYGSRLALVDYDGTHRRMLTGRVSGRQITRPVWSPDGKTLYIGMCSSSCASFYRIYVVSVSNGGATALPGGSTAEPETVRRDGRLIALDTVRAGERWMRTGVVASDGSARHDAGPANLWDASWQPGTNYVAVSRVLRDVTDAVTIQIQLLNTRTGSYHALPETQSASTYGAAYPLAWTKDGSHLFYLHFNYRNGDQVDPRVFRVRADGTGRTDVTPSIPTWNAGQIALQGR